MHVPAQPDEPKAVVTCAAALPDAIPCAPPQNMHAGQVNCSPCPFLTEARQEQDGGGKSLDREGLQQEEVFLPALELSGCAPRHVEQFHLAAAIQLRST